MWQWYCLFHCLRYFILCLSFCLSAQRRDSFPALTTPRLQAGRHFCKHLIISLRCFLVLLPWGPWLDSSLLLYPDSYSVLSPSPSFFLSRSLSLSLFCIVLFILKVYSLTHWLVSEALWPEEDSFAGVWHDDNLCIPSLRPGRRHQTLGWVQTKPRSVRFLKSDNIGQICLPLTFIFDWIASLSPTGIMAILFAGIVMSHYTHHNLSPVTQILMQQTLRTVAFMCGQRSPHFLQEVSLYSVSLMLFFCLFFSRDVCVCFPRPLHLQLPS